MLLNYEVNNFAVFKDNIKFSMKAGRTLSRFEDNVITVHSKMKVSKVAVIVGENASGKTYFMTSLHFFKYLIQSNDSIRSLTRLCNNYNSKEPQNFKIIVLVAEKIYTYELSIDTDSILSEKLSFRGYKSSPIKDIIIFENNRVTKDLKTEMSVTANTKFISKEIKSKLSTNENSLFLNKISTLNIKEIEPFINWIKNKLVVDLPSDVSLNIYKEMEKDEKNIKIIKSNEFLEIFALVDSSIVAIELDERDPFRETKIIRKKSDGELFSISLKNDSAGVIEFFAWSVQIWKVIYEDATLFADELDKVLNPILSSRVLAFVKGSEHKGQFVFSTHNIFHLNTVDFMKEQIYFVSKNPENLTSELYSLGDFKDYRYEKSDVYTLYLKGLLGGVPNE